MLVACSGSNASKTAANSKPVRGEKLDDPAIHLWVDEALSLDPRIGDPDRITVRVNDGIVTLSGTAASLVEKRYATLEAEKIAGVRGVIDEIELAFSNRSDDEVRADVTRRLSNRPSLDLEGLEVDVVDGNVTLRGTVRSLDDLKHAELIASEVRGVRDIEDLLHVSYRTPISDEDNRDQIVAALDIDPYLTGLPISVRVSKGIAVLEGTVGNLYQRRRAAEDARRVASVLDVQNELEVDWLSEMGTRESAPYPTDDQIARAVRDSLLQDLRVLHPDSIDVSVGNGVVTLQGEVGDWYQRKALDSDAGDTVGVVEVLDLVQVGTEGREDRLVSDEIELDLQTDYLLAGNEVTVDVDDGVATLSGQVDSPYEKSHAEQLAYGVPGVRRVVNKLSIPSGAAYTDAALGEHIAARLRSNWTTRYVADGIQVKVEEGAATLTGRVATWTERMEAGRVAQQVDGIREVNNGLVVGTL
jgi:osmotically-inducible protein OsmY